MSCWWPPPPSGSLAEQERYNFKDKVRRTAGSDLEPLASHSLLFLPVKWGDAGVELIIHIPLGPQTVTLFGKGSCG